MNSAHGMIDDAADLLNLFYPSVNDSNFRAFRAQTVKVPIRNVSGCRTIAGGSLRMFKRSLPLMGDPVTASLTTLTGFRIMLGKFRHPVVSRSLAAFPFWKFQTEQARRAR